MRSFPDDFLWGAATAAHQVEGANTNSSWWALEHAGDSPAVEPSGDACDSYHRYGEDIDLLAASGLRAYRFSVERSRIEPARGEFSQATLDHYQRMVDACLARDVEPVITLHHFTNPLWMPADGGWRAPDAVSRFGDYVDRVLARLDGVARVCTLNEPNMIATWAAGLDAAALADQPLPDPELSQILIAAHGVAVDVARARGVRAGLTLAMTAYTTDDTEGAAAAVADLRAVDEDVFIRAATTGDFLGVQAYTRRFATGDGVLPQGHDLDGLSPHRTLTGWNYYPLAIGEAVRRAADVAPGLPLLVTENGIATADDSERIAYTTDALGSVLDAMQDGAPVEGYFHWSLLDNFEWIHGYAPTFGLVAVDRETFERSPKPSLDWFGRVAKAGVLPL